MIVDFKKVFKLEKDGIRMKKSGALVLCLIFFELVSAVSFDIGDLEQYTNFLYISIGVVILLILIVLVLIFKKKNLKVKIKAGRVGEEIDITINPGKAGAGNKIQLFSGDLKIGELPLCPELVCYDSRTLKYKIPESWKPGKYKIHVQDLKKGWKDFEFDIQA